MKLPVPFFSLFFASTLAWSAVSVPAIFSDHAVLQRGGSVPVWGRAEPGEKVRVSLGGIEAEAVTASDGRWQIELDLSQCGEGPFELIVEGTNKLAFSDVLVGEVWLCSGQSNMELSLASSENGKDEIAASANPRLRQFLVEKQASRLPSDEIRGRWMVASPEASAQFSAVAYYFGKQLVSSLNRPVGLINASVGGTQAEAWISAAALDTDTTLQQAKEKQLSEQDVYPERLASFVQKLGEWERTHQRSDRPDFLLARFASEEYDASLWRTITLPYQGGLAEMGFADAGVVWLRRSVKLTEGQATQFSSFELPVTKGFEKVFINGTLVGETLPESGRVVANRQFHIPRGVLRAGENVMALRVFQPVGGAGDLAVGNGSFRLGSLPLGGEWLIAEEFGLPTLSPDAVRAAPVAPAIPQHALRVPSLSYNGMIHPLIPYGLAGVIWYQGEANTWRPQAYQKVLPLLISSWRKDWNKPDLPFYFCQLPNFQARHSQPQKSLWAELRESQDHTLAVPHTGMAVLIDLGEEKDIHPANKKGPGERLAAIALARSYKQPQPCEGPRYASHGIEGSAIRVKFKDLSMGLVARDIPATYKPSSRAQESVALVRNRPQSELEGFALCGADQQWRWADARIEGDTVVVSSPEVPAPVAVRYAWADNPICNLYSRAGYPAAPFRTDSFDTTR